MALIPDETIEQILERVDIVELASRYMSLKRSGVNNMGCCPFHDEKTPSFNVNSARQRYHCFGCKADGHAISLLMHFEGLGFREACKRLAGEVGIEIEERRDTPEEERRRRELERLQQVNAIAAEFFHRQLLEAPEAEGCRQYLNRRGYGRKSAAGYQLGYAPERWDALVRHLQERQVHLEDARALGLIRSRESGDGDYDLFRGRLIFPIHDLSGHIVAFGGRILGDGQPKYINSPESPIYHKGRVLYGLYGARQAIRRSNEVILVEGYFDQLALARAGVDNAVATCGTALTEEHARLLGRYARRVLLLFDNDSAGRNATFKALALLLPTGLEAAVVELEAGEDPDSYLRKHGKEAFAERLQQARPALELFIAEQLAAAAPGVAGTSRAAREVLEMLALLTNPLELDLSLKELGRQSGIEIELLREQLELVKREQRERSARQARRMSPLPSADPGRESPPFGADEVPPPFEPEETGAAADVARERPRAKLARPDALRLRLLIFEAEARRIAAEGVEAFFGDPVALQLAQQLLEVLADVAEGQELTRLQQHPELLEKLPRPLEYDRAAYADVTVVRDSFARAREEVEKQRQRERVKATPPHDG